MEWRPLDVTVISATDLKNVNFFTTMSVYVKISILGYAKNTKKTFVDKKCGTSAKWNYSVKFTLDEPSLTKPGLTLFFRIRSKRFFNHTDIGIVSIPINDVFDQSDCGPDGSDEKVVDYQVFTPVAAKPSGMLKFSFKFGKKYEQPGELMYKIVNQSSSMYNENTPVTAYPITGTNNMPPPGMGYGISSPNHDMAAYHQPAGYHPAGYYGGGYPPAGYPPAGYPPMGYPQAEYGYPPQQQQQQQQQEVHGGYPPMQQIQEPQKNSKGLGMGAGVGLGLAGGLIGGLVVHEMVSDNTDACDQGYDDAIDDNME